MAKYKLTITDMESGGVELEAPCDGLMGAIISQSTGNVSLPSSFSIMFELSPADMASILIALDSEKEHLMAMKPVAAQFYGMRDKILREHIDIDIGELEKQAGEL